MEASSFDEANLVLQPPADMTVDECTPLNVWHGSYPGGQPVVISCWKLTQEELEEFKRTGRIWLHVFGATMPPVYLGANHPFKEKHDASSEQEGK